MYHSQYRHIMPARIASIQRDIVRSAQSGGPRAVLVPLTDPSGFAFQLEELVERVLHLEGYVDKYADVSPELSSDTRPALDGYQAGLQLIARADPPPKWAEVHQLTQRHMQKVATFGLEQLASVVAASAAAPAGPSSAVPSVEPVGGPSAGADGAGSAG